LAFVT